MKPFALIMSATAIGLSGCATVQTPGSDDQALKILQEKIPVPGVRSDFLLRSNGVVRIYSGITDGKPIEDTSGQFTAKIVNNDFLICEIAVLSFTPAYWAGRTSGSVPGYTMDSYKRRPTHAADVVTVTFDVSTSNGSIGPFWYTLLIQA